MHPTQYRHEHHRHLHPPSTSPSTIVKPASATHKNSTGGPSIAKNVEREPSHSKPSKFFSSTETSRISAPTKQPYHHITDTSKSEGKTIIESIETLKFIDGTEIDDTHTKPTNSKMPTKVTENIPSSTSSQQKGPTTSHTPTEQLSSGYHDDTSSQEEETVVEEHLSTGHVWTEDDMTEMEALEMTEVEFAAYKNLAGLDEYSIASAGDAMIDIDNEADEKHGWHDEGIEETKIADLEKDTEERRIKELFEPRHTGNESSTVAHVKSEDLTSSTPKIDEDSAMTSPSKDIKKHKTAKTTSNKLMHDINDQRLSQKIDNSHFKPTQSQGTLSNMSAKNNSSSSTSTTTYKAVNPTSLNRSVGLSSGRDKTPDAKNKSKYLHQYETRVSLKLSIPPTDDPLSKIRQILKELIREAHQIDKEVEILTWRSRSHLEPLSTSSPIPDTVTGMHKYLHKLYVPKQGEQTYIYPQLSIGHDTSFSNFRDELLPWLTSNGHGMFYNMSYEMY